MGKITDHLLRNERKIIKAALQATCEGDFFKDWEFQTLIGVDRETVKSILNDWPEQKLEYDEFRCAIKYSMIMLLMYPHGLEDDLNERIPGGVEALEKLVKKLF